LQRRLNSTRSEINTTVVQRNKGLIDQRTFEEVVGPLNLVRDELQNEIAMLEEQRQVSESQDTTEHRITEAFKRYADRLDAISDEEWRGLMTVFQIRLDASLDRVLITGQIDPKLITTEHTSASNSSDSFSGDRRVGVGC